MKQVFFQGGINRDITPKFLGENYTDAQNIIFQTGKDGKGGLLRMYPGFLKIGTDETLGQTYGHIEDKANSKVYYFLTDSIWVYDQIAGTRTKIFEWAGLGTAKKHGSIIANYLLWTDNLKQPRYINVTRDYQNIIEDDITIIRPAPLFPLVYQVKTSAVDYSPFNGYAYQFSYRYVYEDNQNSVIAPFTESIYGDTTGNFIEAIYLSKDGREELPKYVRAVELLVRRNDWDFWQVWETLTPQEFLGNIFLDYIATQSGSPYVDANTLIIRGDAVLVYEFTESSSTTPFVFEAGTQIQVRNWIIEALGPGTTDPQLYIDIYKNGVLWQRRFIDIVDIDETISVFFTVEAGNYYQSYTYSVADGVPLENPFSTPFLGTPYKGDNLGRALPRNETVKPFESVPYTSKTLEVARDRVFLANNTEGYDRYEISSLTATVTTDIQDLQPTEMEVWVTERNLYEEDYTIFPPDPFVYTEQEFNYYVRFGDKFYFFKAGSLVTSSPFTRPSDYTGLETTATIDINTFFTESQLVFSTETGSEGVGDLWRTDVSVLTKVDPEHIVTTNLQSPDTVGASKFKNRSQYRIGIVFYDRYLRNQGTYTNANCIATINDDFRSGAVSAIRWDISAADNINIPIWADAYQIVRTDNLSRVTFQQGLTTDIYWVYLDAGVEKYSRTFRTDAEYVEIDLSGSLKSGNAYNFTQGDLIEIESAGVFFTYGIIGFTGSKLRINSVSNSAFETTVSPFPVRLYYEIYTPRSVAENLVFYEVSRVFEVLNKRTVDRSFSVLSGFLKGDVTVVDSETFEYPDARDIIAGEFSTNDLEATPVDIVVEARNPDLNPNVGWIKDLGRANAVIDFDQITKEGSIRFSNKFVQGTRVNGISNFDPFDEEVMGVENGQVNRLVLASKSQQFGTVMLAICEQEALSIYLGETQFTDNQGQSVIGSSAKVIGTVNVLSGGYGTKHTNSVVAHEGRVWWWDAYAYQVVRYDPNGARSISDLGMKSFFYGRTAEPLLGYDPFHKLLFVKFDSVLSFDENSNEWRSFYQFVPDWFGKINEFLVAFKDGIPYRSNNSNYANYFGTQNNGIFTFKLVFPSPQILENIGLYLTENAFCYEANRQVLEDCIEIIITNDRGQETNLINSDFEVNEDVAYAHILRDENSTGGLLGGDEMRDDIFTVQITLKEDIGIETIIFNENRSSGHI